MVKGFFMISCLLSVLLLAGIFHMNKHQNKMTVSIRYLFLMAILTIMSNAVSVVLQNERIATLCHGLYFAFTDWLMIALLMFSKKYLEGIEDKVAVRFAFIVGAILDTISMIVNTFTHHVFSCKQVAVNENESCYITETDGGIYGIHLVFVYGIVLMVLILFILKAFQTTKMYRKKYTAVLYAFLCILAVNISYRFVKFPIDVSVLIYGVLAVAIAYFSLHYVPGGLVEELLSMVVKDIDAGILCFDRDGRCVHVNLMADRLLSLEGSRQKAEEHFRSVTGGKSMADMENRTWEESQEIEGKTYHYLKHIKRLLDDRGSYLGCFYLISDQTENEEALEKERYRATHDMLTKIYNREGFFERVREELAKNPNEERYIICSDIKDFKLVNDLFGMEKGDEILVRTAELIMQQSSEGTVCGRIEADRFAMCMYKKNYKEEVFVRYINKVCAMAKNDVFRMHIHIGVYRISDPTMEISVMCDRAQLAIQKIKDDYQSIISYYDEELGKALHGERKMISEFDRAIEEGQFQIFLQPQISVENKLLGAEALVRWFHPEKGMISPGVFIPVFEKTGFIHRLDLEVWEMACQQLRKWKDQGREDLHISVNISPKDLYYVNIYDVFISLVEKYEIDPMNLKLEITETAIMTEVKQQISLLERLRAYGFHIEIDDFGSGYSSLNTLKDIDVDVLKIDMGFLSETGDSKRGQTIMNMVISMSKQLGLSVVTEGVETREQVDYLTNAGCDIFQGYYFAKPMQVNEFEKKYL